MIAQITRITAAREWYLDSGATIHVVGSRNSFMTYRAVTGRQVMMANRDKADVCGVRTVQMKFTSGKTVTLHKVLHVPTISMSLVSVGKLNEHGFKVAIESRKVVITKHGLFMGKGYYQEGMYRLNVENEPPKNVSENNHIDSSISSNQIFNSSLSGNFDSNGVSHVFEINEISVVSPVCSISLWHKRLAHINVKNIEKMKSIGLIKFQNKDFEKCETCVKSKFVKKPFPSVKRDTGLLELIHSDICELNGILTRGGKRYFITFCDDSSRFLYVYLLRSKDEAFDSFKIYKAEVENQLGKRIKVLRSDRGGEYFTREFDTFCEENGIKHERTSPYTPQQNGLAERKNRTLVEMVNCMLNQSELPTNLWGEALLAACHIHNRITSRVIPMSPYELWNGRKPNLDYLRVWGCLAYYRTPEPKRSKLGARGIKSVFVGYAKNSKAYRLLNENSGVIIESRDVEFFE
ncbi:retrovirus-related pol polyprotein from transposon TNT 1-94, partial [Tanacetum coccineum]